METEPDKMEEKDLPPQPKKKPRKKTVNSSAADSSPPGLNILITGAEKVLEQYKKNHRELLYPGMAELVEGLALLKKS